MRKKFSKATKKEFVKYNTTIKDQILDLEDFIMLTLNEKEATHHSVEIWGNLQIIHSSKNRRSIDYAKKILSKLYGISQAYFDEEHSKVYIKFENSSQFFHVGELLKPFEFNEIQFNSRQIKMIEALLDDSTSTLPNLG